MDSDLQFDMPLWIAGPAVLLCLLLAAYLSAAETAITGVSRPRMHRLAQQGNKRATIVNALLDRKDETVSAVLLGNNVVNIFSASLTTAVLTALFGAAGVVYATIAIGVLVVIFSAVIPKTWALLRADRVVLILAPYIEVNHVILGPLLGLAHDGVAHGAVRVSRCRLSNDRDRRAGRDYCRGHAQDLGIAARRPRGAHPGAVHRGHPGNSGADGTRRRLGLALLP